MPKHVTAHPILGTTWSSFGALLIVIGALLLIWDALSGPAGISAVVLRHL